MKYDNIKKGRFLERPNRFIAYAEIEGRIEKVHVKNTGRCKELLVSDAEIYLEKSKNTGRSTAYDLVAVKKGGRLINMDSSAPNKAVEEWLGNDKLFQNVSRLRPETVYQNSRFDFYAEYEKDGGIRKAFIEVKGVTLEEEGAARFPDAPSERAVKHVEELIKAKKEGYEAYIIFVIQMQGVSCFEPNDRAQPEFGQALRRAWKEGVSIKAYDCMVTEEGMEIREEVPIALSVFDRIGRPLLSWYDGGHRSLPWREDATGYHVWLSEIMLQQTRVEAVKPYYERFLKILPDIPSLAGVNEDVLLKLWEGLGYYNRVKNMQKAAKLVMEEYDGRLPEEYEELCKLPGIGSYTAGAVSSIAYGKPVPAVDGNVLRVVSRLCMLEADILSTQTKKEVEQELRNIIPKDRPGDFNQAMMELGALVCVPNGMAKCQECPLAFACKACQEGRVQDFPVKRQKKPRKIEKKTVLILRDEERVAIRKRENKGLLAGLYEFPMLEGHRTPEQVVSYLREIGLHSVFIKSLEDSRHIFTHKEWHMVGYVVRVDELMPVEGKEQGFLFVEPKETEKTFPIPSAFAAYTKYLNIKLGNDRFYSDARKET